MHQLRIRALGALVEVSIEGITDPEYERLVSIWRQCLVSPERHPRATDASVRLPLALNPEGGRGSYRDFASLAADLSSLVTLRAIENTPAEWLLLHAAAVAHPDSGLVVGFLGPSGAGKSTLAQTLAKRFGYVTDETLAVNLLTGEVLPYPKPLSIIESAGARVKGQYSPEELGLKATPAVDLRLAALFVLDRADADYSVDELNIAEAVELLLPQVSYLDRQVEPASSLVRAVEFGGGLKRVTYREASELVELASQVFAAPPSPATPSLESWQPVSQPTISASDQLSGSVIRATDFRQALVGREATIVYRDGQVFVLDGIGGDIWLFAQTPISRSELVTELIKKRGMPPTGSPKPLIRDAIEMLCTNGLVAYT